MDGNATRPVISTGAVIGVCFTMTALGAVYLLSSWHPFKWSADIKTVTGSTVDELRRVSQLVVLRGKITVSRHVRAEKSAWILNMGATEVALLAPNNRFQYFVKLDGLTDESFRHDPLAKRWTLRIPKPTLDTEMIVVESDPAKIEIVTKVGWARFDSYSGQALRDAAKREIRDEVLDQANQAWIHEAAEDAARGALSSFVTKVIRKIPDDETLTIEFVDGDQRPKNSQ